jgi:DNA-binding LacI/PurR family transcriptional regulator
MGVMLWTDEDEHTERAADHLAKHGRRRAGLIECPVCWDYLEDHFTARRRHAATCAALRAETPEAGR